MEQMDQRKIRGKVSIENRTRLTQLNCKTISLQEQLRYVRNRGNQMAFIGVLLLIQLSAYSLSMGFLGADSNIEQVNMFMLTNFVPTVTQFRIVQARECPKLLNIFYLLRVSFHFTYLFI